MQNPSAFQSQAARIDGVTCYKWLQAVRLTFGCFRLNLKMKLQLLANIASPWQNGYPQLFEASLAVVSVCKMERNDWRAVCDWKGNTWILGSFIENYRKLKRGFPLILC